jgi:hypothetical protein
VDPSNVGERCFACPRRLWTGVVSRVHLAKYSCAFFATPTASEAP